MEDQIRQIGERIKGLREDLEVTVEQAAAICGVGVEKYLEYEQGTVDIPVGVLHNLARRYGVELTTLLTGEDPHMRDYSLTRKGKGISVERVKAYTYQALAFSFINRKADPFLVTVEPKPEELPVSFNSHPGQEFNFMLEGRMKFFLNDKEMILEEGDSIYFNCGLPHGMKALDGRTCKFLAFIF